MKQNIKSFFIAIFLIIIFSIYAHASDSMLKWDASTEDVSGYIIYYGLSLENYPLSEDVGNVTQYPLANFTLSEGTTYFFVVRGYNAAGESGDSNVISYAVPIAGDTTPPLPPEGVSGEIVNGGILLKWQANSENDIAGYRVYSGTSSRDYGLPIPVEGTENSITGLVSNVTLYIAVSSVDTAGNESGYSSPEIVETIVTEVDTQAPVVTITSPTSGTTYAMETSSLNISGSASDSVGLDQVSWSNSRGGSGTAAGTESWSTTGISLAEGENVITVTASDKAGNTATDSLAITYIEPVLDTQPPSLTLVNPTSGIFFFTREAAIVLSGTSSDDTGIKEIKWVNAQGGTGGIANGTTTWEVANVPLARKWNTITITAEDDAGNKSVYNLRVYSLIKK